MKNSQPGSRELAKYSDQIVEAAYRVILGRDPDAANLSEHAKELSKTGDLSAVLASIAGSKEAWERTLYRMPEELVRLAYRGLLGREPDPSGLVTHSQSLGKTGDFVGLLSRLSRSREHREKFLRGNARPFCARDLVEEKLVFLHIPKTGGTTLHNIFASLFEEGEICPERFNGLRHIPAGELARFRYFSGHFDLPSVRLIPGRSKVVTMLRDPVERLISLYYFQRAHRPEVVAQNNLEMGRLAHKYSMLAYFRAKEVRSHPGISNAMTRVLTDTLENQRREPEQGKRVSRAPGSMAFLELAIRELESLDAFGILERYDESVELICQAVGFHKPAKIKPLQVLDVIVATEPGLNPIEKEPVTEEVRNEIESLVRTDMELYRHACSLFRNPRLSISPAHYAPGGVRSR